MDDEDIGKQIVGSMKTVQWDIQNFRELDVAQLYTLLKLRVDVFVVEQACAYAELDEYDRHGETMHLSGQDEQGKLIAYARLLPPGLRYPEVNLGRVVVKKESRRKGIGHKLLDTALKEIEIKWPRQAIKISAQDYLQEFYEQYGFTRVSDIYLEDGVPHIEMLKK